MNKKTLSELVDKYTYRVEWSEFDKAHIAVCLEFPSLSAVETTTQRALASIREVVAASIEWMLEEGERVPEPFGLRQYRGNLTLRVPSYVHREIAIRSAEEGVSINQYVLSRV
jgi:predicted HicB family RNase H-like nuclease